VITRLDLDQRVREWGLRHDVVEKDYVIGWLLWGIGSEPELSASWVFKGGTCLKKCYIETYRFSEDLDFTILPGGPIQPEALAPIFNRLLSRAHDASGIDFSARLPTFRLRPSATEAEGRVFYHGPRGAPTEASVKLDLSASEQVLRPAVQRPISHAYPDELPSPATVACYCLEEVFAEKIRAMGERGRPRDLYDIINLYRRDGLRADPSLIRQILAEKCESKGVARPTQATIEASPFHHELESEWANMLGHQLPQLPPFESFWSLLPEFFAWLQEELARPILAPVPAREAIDASWMAPPTVSIWGVSFPVEAIRFAATNRLCVLLAYAGTVREVEPYSFRRTRAGNILLYSVKAESGEVRSYRLDRIEAARVSSRTFVPRFVVEIGAIGPADAPRLRRPRTRW